MSAVWKRAPQSAIPLADVLLVFAFFVLGVTAAFFTTIPFPGQAYFRLFLCGLLGGIVLFSVSAWGTVLLPLFAMAAGAFSEHSAMLSVLYETGGRSVDWRMLVCNAVLVPIVFLCTSHGMTVSSALNTAMERGSPTARTVFHRELFLVLIFSLVGFACVFYFF